MPKFATVLGSKVNKKEQPNFIEGRNDISG